MEAAECGVASLSMILAYHGRHIPVEQLRIDVGVSRDGSKAGNLIRAAEKYGLKGRGFKKSAEALNTTAMPCVVLLRGGHFAVLEGFGKKNAFLNDPAFGRRKLRKEEFREQYSGVVLTFEPDVSFVGDKSTKRKSVHIAARPRTADTAYRSFVVGVMLRRRCFAAEVIRQSHKRYRPTFADR